MSKLTTIYFAILRSLCNHDNNGNENVTKQGYRYIIAFQAFWLMIKEKNNLLISLICNDIILKHTKFCEFPTTRTHADMGACTIQTVFVLLLYNPDCLSSV